jgi:hypothetical protein
MLRSGATRLERQLDRFATGERWKEHLQTARLRQLAAEDVNHPPDVDTVRALHDTLQLYEAAAERSQSRIITTLDGFAVVRAALKELVIPPLDRQRRQLADSAKDLHRELTRLNTGSEWIHYLRLPDDVFSDEPGDLSAPTPVINPARQESLALLIEAQARYDEVSHNPEFRQIRELPAFQTTRDRLATYVSLLTEALSEPRSDEGQIEVIPTPLPEPR